MWTTPKKQQNLLDSIKKLQAEKLYYHRLASKMARTLVYALSAIEADKGKTRGSKVVVAKIEGYIRSTLSDLAQIQGKDVKTSIKRKT